ncbi:MAG: DNA internalization-related competence protein ComEC/Rec2 [Mariprofundaceae bacterium]|nr:DNA internalization-related competence protein ComEC/Rec2 [Mariprofundaceae bacterium]
MLTGPEFQSTVDRLPLLAPVTGWLAGLAVARIESVSLEFAIALTLFACLSLLLIKSGRIFIFSLLAGLVWGLFMLFQDARTVSVDESWLNGSQQVSATVEKLERSSSFIRLRIDDIQRADGALLAGKVDVYLYGRGQQFSIRVGDRVRLNLQLRLPRNMLNPGSFDYRTYCFDRHIALIGSAKGLELSESGNSLLERGRERINKAIAAADSHSSGVLQALLLADRSSVTTDQHESFAAAGTSHLLAISGLHVGMVAGWGFVMFWWVLTRREAWIVAWPVRKLALTAGVLMAVGYATVAGWPLTAQRALLMMGAALLAWWLRDRSEPLNTMFAALLLILFVDPAAIVSISLWLSFAAVTALLIWGSRSVHEPDHSFRQKTGRWIAGLFWVSLVAALATLPITADLFGRIPTYTLVANMLLVPLYGLYVLPLSIAGEMLALTGAAGAAAELFAWAAAGVAEGDRFLLLLKSWPAGNLWIPAVSVSATLLYAVGIIFAALLLLRQHRAQALLAAVSTLFIYLLMVVPERSPDVPTLMVWDVGQGAASTLAMPDGRVIVIDSPGRYGSRFNGGTIVADGLRLQGVVHADVVLISHAQSDHAGGVPRLLDHLRSVGELWIADVTENRDYRPIGAAIKQIEERGGMVRWLKRGDRLSIGDADVAVLWPPAGYTSRKHNNLSLVVSIQLPTGERLLFPADIERDGEAGMIGSGLDRHDLMLVPHHGSRSSSTPEWVQAIRPGIAIVQSGWNNRYRFPYPDIVDRYEKTGATVLDTKVGAVSVRFGDKVTIDQYRPELTGKRDTALQWWRTAL